MKFHAIPLNCMEFHAIPLNCMEHNHSKRRGIGTILCNFVQLHKTTPKTNKTTQTTTIQHTATPKGAEFGQFCAILHNFVQNHTESHQKTHNVTQNDTKTHKITQNHTKSSEINKIYQKNIKS